MKRALVVACALLSFAAVVRAQEACPMETGVPALTLSDMYKKAEAKARAWKSDVVTVRVTNTSMGPLDAGGHSEAWNLTFFSPSANQVVAINTFRGMFTCYVMPTAPGRIPDLKPDFFRDGGKLYAIAKEKGASYISQGYRVMVGTAAAPETRHATWYITYSKEDGTTAPFTVILDANTGAIEKVLNT